jgi:hypothetical protein
MLRCGTCSYVGQTLKVMQVHHASHHRIQNPCTINGECRSPSSLCPTLLGLSCGCSTSSTVLTHASSPASPSFIPPGMPMIAVHSNTSVPIQCPADGCPDTHMDHRRFGEHIKSSHTLPAAVVLVPETPVATPSVAQLRPHPYLPTSSVASAHLSPTSHLRSSSPSLAFPSSSDEAFAQPPSPPNPGEPTVSMASPRTLWPP